MMTVFNNQLAKFQNLLIGSTEQTYAGSSTPQRPSAARASLRTLSSNILPLPSGQPACHKTVSK